MTSAANVHDSMVFEELLDAIEPIKRPGRGRPRKRPEKLHADKAHDDKKCARALRKRGIKRRIARKGVESSKKLGRHRLGGGADAGVGSQVPQAHDSLRAAGRYPRGIPISGLFSDLSQLPLVKCFERITSTTVVNNKVIWHHVLSDEGGRDVTDGGSKDGALVDL